MPLGMMPPPAWVGLRPRPPERLKYARFVNLATDEDIPAYFSDNFFDMPPGATKRITISSPEPFDPRMLKLNHWLTTWD